MKELSHLVEAVRERLSEEDRTLLRTVYFPAAPERYDELFDRVLDRLKGDPGFETDGRSRPL